jgi:peptidoglycan/xylan/chitin deacetylase (PgdA/CDA1 family)
MVTLDSTALYAPPAEIRIPTRKPRFYLTCTRWAHQVQVASARRRHEHQGLWTSGARILLYHRVSPQRDGLTVTTDAFRAQMECILEVGARPVDLDKALVASQRGTLGRHVSITFDDGYHDNLDYAIPVLRELGIPATIFPISAVTDGRARMYWYDEPPPTLSWDELRDIARDGLFSIGAHTRTHPDLTKLTDEAAWGEIAGCRDDLEDRLGQPVTSFVYPAGRQGEREIRMAREAGYSIALTCVAGVNGPADRPHALRRTPVSGRDSLGMFEARLAGLLDRPWGIQDLLSRQRSSGR